jgi:hypothetical protein
MSRDAESKGDPKTEPRIYDKRTVERNIKKGLLTRKDYEKHLKALEDIADKGVYGTPADDDDDDDFDEEEVEDQEAATDGAPTGNSHSS